jgi:hypothetical protein
MSVYHKDNEKVEMKDLKVVKKIVLGQPVNPMDQMTNEN